MLFDNILAEANVSFLRWAIHAIITWPYVKPTKSIIHIHGTDDTLLPLHFVQADYVIKGGSHFMVYSLAKEVSSVLAQVLEDKKVK